MGDILTTIPLAATGNFKNQANEDLARVRVKGLYVVCGTSAGSVVLRERGVSGSVIFTVNTPTAANAGAISVLIPGDGILADAPLHGTVTNTASTTVLYG